MARVSKVKDKKTGKIYSVLPPKGFGPKVNRKNVAAKNTRSKYA